MVGFDDWVVCVPPVEHRSGSDRRAALAGGMGRDPVRDCAARPGDRV